MSYSSELKKTLKDASMKKKCCRRAYFYGEQLFMPANKRAENVDWTKFGYGENEIPSRIIFENFRCTSCKSSFLRGVFCSVGTVSDPEKSLHLEFKTKEPVLADLLFLFLEDNGIEMKRRTSGCFFSLYLKKGDDIEDLMHFMGAGKEAFEVANQKIKRDFSNLANRRRNFEVVNIQKTVDASSETITAIQKLEKTGKLSELPKGLQETAALRMDNPFANLEELAALHSDKISKSGVNHRLKKLIELAELD